MKRNATLILLVATVFFHLNAKAYAQGITIKVTDVTLDKVFSMIQKQTNFVFVYSGKQLAGTKKVSVNVVNEKLEKVMEVVMDGQPLKYEIDKEYVIIKQKGAVGEIALNKLPEELAGRVTNEKGEPVASATITVKNSNTYTATDADGRFVLRGVDDQAEIVITCIGYETKTVKLDGEKKVLIKMALSARTIDAVVVKGSTGYQVIDKKHPGSFDVIDNELLNRSVSPNILDRIENLTAGISSRNIGDGLLIRGRNSIYSNVNPLIILDNFPYDGPINNIDPNDIENVTILKDAAAAAQWGARAGNGVIVITSKRGKSNKPTVSINTNFTTQGRPRLSKLPIISSKDAVELEEWLFNKGYYNSRITNKTTYPVLSPVQEILLKKRSGQVNEAEANAMLEKFKKNNVVDDLENFFYQPYFAQQYSLNVSGNSPKISYYMSAGFSKQRQSMVGVLANRVSIKSANTFRITTNLSVDAGLTYTQLDNKQGGNSGININSGGGAGLYPYADLVDGNGNALSIVKGFRNSYKDTAGKGNLLDWNYRPYDEIAATTTTAKSRDVLINVGIKYLLPHNFSAEIRYQFENTVNSGLVDQKLEAYNVRDLINKYYQPYAKNKYPVPIGGILDVSTQEALSHQGRVQISYDKRWNDKHDFHVMAGWEIKNLKRTAISNRIYGYQKEGSIVNTSMDFVTMFPLYYRPAITAQVTNVQSVDASLDRFLSLYSTAIYTFDNRLTVSGSARKDEANLFGARTNQRGAPLWSIGMAWEINEEQFYKFSLIPLLKLRASYGHSGNFTRNSTGVATMQKNSALNFWGLADAFISNPPNERLRWEQNRILNLGLDFEFRNNVITGTIEFYKKNNIDLMAPGPIDPTSGLTPIAGGRSFYFGNVASVKGKGVDVTINTLNLDKDIKWVSTFLLSYTQSKVSEYLLPASNVSQDYIYSEGYVSPIVNKPIYSFYGYRWGGLDPETGDPRGYLGKELSKDYQSIMTKTKVDSLHYIGQAQPLIFGAVRNTLSWKQFSLSANISYRFKYFMRRQLINYNVLYSAWTGSSDYAKRWQDAGDELHTDVPSRKYVTEPNFTNRDAFYLSSELPIVKGDNIRFEDVSLSYNISGRNKARVFEQIRVYSYFNNLGLIIWKANKNGIDPDYPQGNTTRINITLGLNVTF